jgi:predicted nucleotidyltransferase component of viral defense system
MLDFQEIQSQYPDSLKIFQRALLREYLQYKVLQAIFDSEYAYKLSFLGGTALRIVYNNRRFSEDIDLDNFDLDWVEFGKVIHKVQRLLSLEGFETEVRSLKKGAFHCYIRIPKLLYQMGLSPLEEEKILIQVDSVEQNFDYQPEIKLLNKFDVFTQIRVMPKNVLLSQKIFSAVNRKRPKGRDFFDITFLFGITQPELNYLYEKMDVSSPEELREYVRKRISEYDFEDLANDVAPFLINKNELTRIIKFRDFWQQVDLG